MSFTTRVPGAVLTEREHIVPLDHARPDGPSITVFTREVADPDGLDRPYLALPPGRPGLRGDPAHQPALGLDEAGPEGLPGAAPRPARHRPIDAGRAADPRVHARGAGRRTSPTSGPIPIVRDAELIRRELGVDRWSVLGQSFGGFTSMTYLSIAPEGLREAFITGGLVADRPAGRRRLRAPPTAGSSSAPSATSSATRRTAPGSARSTAGSTARTFLLDDRRPAHGPPLPPARPVARRQRRVRAAPPHRGAAVRIRRRSGTTSRGRSGSSATRSTPRSTSRPTPTAWPLAGPPTGSCPTRSGTGSASPPSTSSRGCSRTTGALRPHRAAAELLAEHPWPRLYDAAQLAVNEVPVAATIYVNDLYVERAFAEETAAQVRGLRTWITDEYDHNGLRADGERVLDRLIDLARGRV